jgi:hypothetical protein
MKIKQAFECQKLTLHVNIQQRDTVMGEKKKSIKLELKSLSYQRRKCCNIDNELPGGALKS